MPIPSVVAIFTHQSQVFLVQRQDYLKAFPGFYSFPGGKLDQADHQEPNRGGLWQALEPAVAAALRREVKEETNLDLLELEQAGLIQRIDLLGQALTPPIAKVRFLAHYIRIELKQALPITLDPGEAKGGAWQEAAHWWQEFQQGRLLAVIPTLRVLQGMAQDPQLHHLDGLNLEMDFEEAIPKIELLKGVGIFHVPSHTLPPASTTNCLLLGDEQPWLVDPSPKSEAHFQRLLKGLEGQKPQGIFLSHHHPDHHQNAPRLARHLGAAMAMSAWTYQELVQDHGEDYFSGLAVQLLAEGDQLTTWLGQPVRVLAVPGHDHGHLALAPPGLEWCFVGDLVQQGGSIMINEKDGDMRAYFQSLQRIIDLNPRVVIPSHGMPHGGLHLVTQALAHRREREAAILAWSQMGLEEDAILKEVYPELPPDLKPLAIQNIRTHQKKLVLDGLLPGKSA